MCWTLSFIVLVKEEERRTSVLKFNNQTCWCGCKWRVTKWHSVLHTAPLNTVNIWVNTCWQHLCWSCWCNSHSRSRICLLGWVQLNWGSFCNFVLIGFSLKITQHMRHFWFKVSTWWEKKNVLYDDFYKALLTIML